MTKRIFPASAVFLSAAVLFVSCGDGSGGLSGTGVSGSTSRFAVVGDYLYVLNEYREQGSGGFSRTEDALDTFSLEERENPVRVHRLEMGLIVPETLHAVGQNLFVGTTSGMQIISLTVPESPNTLSFTGHFTSRDPVVVSGSTAYVTLRTIETETSRTFARGANELQIFDVTDLENPQQLNTYEMTAPWGLGVRHDRAYICDGSAGMRILSVADPQDIKEVAAVNTDICFDVLVTDTLLVSTGASGVTQYRIEAGSDAPVQLSTINLQQ